MSNVNQLNQEQKNMLNAWITQYGNTVTKNFDVETVDQFEIYGDLVMLNDFPTINQEINNYVLANVGQKIMV